MIIPSHIHLSETMRGVLLLLSIIFIANANTQDVRTFVDNKGATHTTKLNSPTIVISAHLAVTLGHYGLNNSQLLGTYGEWANSGLEYNFNESEIGGSSSPADPTPEEMRLLKQVANLSPSCKVKEYCPEFNLETLKELNPDFLLVYGFRHKTWAMSPALQQNITNFMGDNIIYIELSMDGSDDCTTDGNYDTCYGKSMIDLIYENLEIAKFLNFNIPSSLKDDMARLCNSATRFETNMEIVHQNGLRVMAAYLSTAKSYFATPIHDMVLRMLEELGMPLLYPGGCTNTTACQFDYFWEKLPIDEYFTNCAESVVSADCNDNTLYPVDFWLYDHRTTLSVTNIDFASGFPDRAIIAQQYDYWPMGGRLITPHHAANILDKLGPSLASAQLLHPETSCTPAIVSEISHRTSGLVGGQYACYEEEHHNPLYFSECSVATTSAPTAFPTIASIATTSVPTASTESALASTTLSPTASSTIISAPTASNRITSTTSTATTLAPTLGIILLHFLSSFIL